MDKKLRYYGVKSGVEVQLNDVRMVQLLDKIKDNALDFSTPGSEISFYLDINQSQQVVISIKNEGDFIPQAQLDVLFQGMMSHREEKTGAPHLGIGLYVAYKIAQFHQAQLTIANRSDKQGVVVSLMLPLSL
jgi:signal transduction histidine kinase